MVDKGACAASANRPETDGKGVRPSRRAFFLFVLNHEVMTADLCRLLGVSHEKLSEAREAAIKPFFHGSFGPAHFAKDCRLPFWAGTRRPKNISIHLAVALGVAILLVTLVDLAVDLIMAWAR